MMGLIVQVSCPDCGYQRVGRADVFAWFNRVTQLGGYRFTCVECQLSVKKWADACLLSVLYTNGITIHDVPLEAIESHSGSAFTNDDLLTFHNAMQNQVYVESITGSDPS